MNNNYQNSNLPDHVAIIMDGNGRWANKRVLPRNIGHKKGAETLQNIIDYVLHIGKIKYLTLYAFSKENWGRSVEEVSYLMDMLRSYLDNDLRDLANKGIRIKVIGNRGDLDKEIQDKITKIEEETKNNQRLNLTIAISYGGRDEIVNMVKEVISDIDKNKLSKDEINEQVINKYLYTKDLPDPDLLIRTSGEKRISNFLLWQMAYTEFYFCDKLWPDFSSDDFDDAIEDYQKRIRKYGR